MTRPRVPVPLMLRAGKTELFGLLTEPALPRAVGVVVIAGVDNIGRGRLQVRLASRFASAGYATLRVDVRGTGESAGGVVALTSRDPFTDDVEAAARTLSERGYQDIVVVGFCYGARAALATAARLPTLAAAVLITPIALTGPDVIRRADRSTAGMVLRRAIRPSTLADLRLRSRRQHMWKFARAFVLARLARVSARHRPESGRTSGLPVDSEFVGGLDQLASRRVPVLLLYGDGDRAFADIQSACRSRLGELLEPGASSIELRVLTGNLHQQQEAEVQEATIKVASDWIAAHFPTSSEQVPTGATDGWA